MKLVTAIIQPGKLQDVKDALFLANISGMTISNVIGCGQQQGYDVSFQGLVHEINLLKKVRIEIAVNDDLVETAVSAIIVGGRTGKIGDGKIFVSPITDVIRIRTGERGKAALCKSPIGIKAHIRHRRN